GIFTVHDPKRVQESWLRKCASRCCESARFRWGSAILAGNSGDQDRASFTRWRVSIACSTADARSLFDAIEARRHIAREALLVRPERVDPRGVADGALSRGRPCREVDASRPHDARAVRLRAGPD